MPRGFVRACYFHDGGSPTLEEAIRRHHGDAEGVAKAYQALPEGDREAVVAFLKTLRAPTDADPVEKRSGGEVALAR